MKQIVDNLRGQKYLTAENVDALRKYIRVKNPDISGEELSAVFADALHKIIDSRISQFEESHRKKIKEDVLRRAVGKSEFSINAAEVFTSCLSLKLQERGYIDGLARWINHSQPVQVSAEKVDKLVASMEQVEEEYLENNLDALIDEFESSETEAEKLQIIEELSCVHEDGKKAQGLSAMLLRSIKYIKPSMKLALLFALPIVLITALFAADMFIGNRIHALQHQDKGRYVNITDDQVDRYLTLESRILKKMDGISGQRGLLLTDELHDELRYVEIDREKLRKWLDRRNSMLAEEPYFTAIISTSKRYDIHPLLMFAVVGQEQGFVPKNGAVAKRIANNPFNVYGSWERYNTDIYDSSSLAADTIIKSSRNRPAYMNNIKWINRRYAEDPNWWNGVSQIFNQMVKEIN